MNETNINKLNSRLEALEKLCHSLQSDLSKLKQENRNEVYLQDSRIIQKIKVKDLKVGDVVILPYCKGYCTIICIEKESRYEYRLCLEEYNTSMVYGEEIEVTFLYSKK